MAARIDIGGPPEPSKPAGDDQLCEHAKRERHAEDSGRLTRGGPVVDTGACRLKRTAITCCQLIGGFAAATSAFYLVDRQGRWVEVLGDAVGVG